VDGIARATLELRHWIDRSDDRTTRRLFLDVPPDPVIAPEDLIRFKKINLLCSKTIIRRFLMVCDGLLTVCDDLLTVPDGRRRFLM
jgi:hypothetical protein